MSIVLRKAAYAEQPCQDTRTLIAVDGSRLSPTQRQVTVTAQIVLIDQDVKRTIHRLKLVVRFVNLHRGIHALPIKIQVAAGTPEFQLCDMGSTNKVVSAAQMLGTPEILDLGTNQSAFRVPE